MSAETAHPGLQHPDLAPIPSSERTWDWRSLASVWFGVIACVPSYLLSRGMLEHGMGWWQAVLVVLIGNLVLLAPMVMIGHAGTRYGISYPVLLRSSFGTLGARLPVVMRSLVGIGWFSIQTWVGGYAIYVLLNTTLGGLLEGSSLPLIGISFWQLLSFLGFWLLQIGFLRRYGTDGVHKLAWYGAPALLGSALLFLLWAWVQADGFGSMLSTTSRFAEGQPMSGQEMAVFPPHLAEMVALWLVMAINIPDYTRYVRDQGQQALGQLIGLPLGIALFSLIGVTIPFATVDIFNTELSDPLDVVARMGGFARLLGLLALVLAAMTTNLFAHLIPASNGLLSLSPQRLDFSKAASVAGVVALVMMPFALLEWSGGGVFIWLAGLSALLSPIIGIMIVDYFLLRGRELDVEALFQHPGPYSATRGVSVSAIVALLLGNLIALPGFLMSVDLTNSGVVPPELGDVYPYTPLIGLAVGGVVYFVGRQLGRLIGGSTDHAPPVTDSASLSD
jgi:nucleobase:cation symporter-1, NCS1 family